VPTEEQVDAVVEPNIRVSMMLADAAQTAEGKLYVLGGGWSVTGPAPMPFAIAVDVKVPWEMANRAHQFRFELVDSAGRTVEVPGPTGEDNPVVVEAELEVGRPPGMVPGTALDAVLAINVPGGLQLTPGARYEWRLMVNGKSDQDWSLPFSVRPLPAVQAA
jgi:hypothetical protein